MSTVAIPNWTESGVLPPINRASTVSTDRSPYAVSLTDLILHFSTSTDRQAILKGFLDFRAALHGVGLVRGFQWLDGSFLEEVERTEGRSPNDIDVVTFAHLPNGLTQRKLLGQSRSLFAPASKATYRVDSYLVQLNGAPAEYLVERSRYWYSLWAHRRTGLWKGYLQVDLDPCGDQRARETLDADGLGEHDMAGAP